MRLCWAGLPIVNVPVAVRYFEEGVSHFDVLGDNLRITATHTRLVFGALGRLALGPRRSRASAAISTTSGWRTWHAERERGSVAGLRVTAACYRFLGRGAARALLHPIVAYFFVTGGTARRASRKYLERLYATPAGSASLGRPPGLREMYRHHLEFGRAVLDRFGFVVNPERFAIEILGEDELTRVVEEGRGAVVLGSHLGSFDAMSLIARRASPLRVNVLMYTRNARRINDLLSAAGSPASTQVRVVEIEPGSYQHVFDARQCVARGEVVAILGDRLPPPRVAASEVGGVERVATVDFLGGRAALPQGPILLAGLLGCPVLLMTGIRRGDRRYEIRVERFADRIALPRGRRSAAIVENCQLYADRLAALCSVAPYQWFNFYDFWREGER